MKTRMIAVAVMLAAVAVMGQAIRVQQRTVRAVSVPGTGSVPVLCSTNAAGQLRSALLIVNTNAVDVKVYASTNATDLIGVVKAGASFSVEYPTIDNGPYYLLGTTAATNTILVTEYWGYPSN